MVISGAAVGCDTAAHRAALDAGGRTVAVLGCGADVAYPRGAGPLLASIAGSGAVVSELEWGYPPAKWTFRARNRIIAGLAKALLVVEAGLGSGTFITADCALDAGRDVMVVPGSIFAPECRGSNRLLSQGAIPVSDISELRAVLEDRMGPPSRDTVAGLLDRGQDPVLAAVRTNPSRPDDVARDLGLDIIEVARRIGALEGAGSGHEVPGRPIRRVLKWHGAALHWWYPTRAEETCAPPARCPFCELRDRGRWWPRGLRGGLAAGREGGIRYA